MIWRGPTACSRGKFWNLRPQMTNSRSYFWRNMVFFIYFWNPEQGGTRGCAPVWIRHWVAKRKVQVGKIKCIFKTVFQLNNQLEITYKALHISKIKKLNSLLKCTTGSACFLTIMYNMVIPMLKLKEYIKFTALMQMVFLKVCLLSLLNVVWNKCTCTASLLCLRLIWHWILVYFVLLCCV